MSRFFGINIETQNFFKLNLFLFNLFILHLFIFHLFIVHWDIPWAYHDVSNQDANKISKSY
jgi:hypothetical protein